MAFWSSIDPPDQAAFTRWHNCEHIPERVSIDGFLRGRRYRSVGDANRFLMFYETRDPEVLASPAYLNALNAPTARTRQALAWFRQPARSVFVLDRQAGRADAWPAPVLLAIRFDATAERAAPTLEGLLAAGPFTRIRSYRSVGAVAPPATTESAIHGARPDPRDGLLLAESGALDLVDEPQVQERLCVELARITRGTALEGASAETYWLEFALDRREA